MPSPLSVVAIAGSLRRESFNRALVRAAVELAPAGLRVVEQSIRGVPLYDLDVEREGDPPGVVALKAAIAAADGVLIATPEYQHGIPGVLKNALDWASRPAGTSPLTDRPVAIMGATPGMTGTARAQAQLRACLVFSRCRVLPPPEVLVPAAHTKIDGEGRLTDADTRRRVAEALDRFEAWIWLFRRAETGAEGGEPSLRRPRSPRPPPRRP